MWIILGIAAAITAFLNLAFGIAKKPNRWFGFSSLSLTALTVCAFYSDAANRVVQEDWPGLMDIMPSMSIFLWVLVVLSIVMNAVPFFVKSHSNHPPSK